MRGRQSTTDVFEQRSLSSEISGTHTFANPGRESPVPQAPHSHTRLGDDGLHPSAHCSTANSRKETGRMKLRLIRVLYALAAVAAFVVAAGADRKFS